MRIESHKIAFNIHTIYSINITINIIKVLYVRSFNHWRMCGASTKSRCAVIVREIHPVPSRWWHYLLWQQWRREIAEEHNGRGSGNADLLQQCKHVFMCCDE